jgi:hypothetical protein
VTFERFTVVRVPFPFSDRNAARHRPALVLSDLAAFNTPAGQSVMAMITSEANAPRPLDCSLADPTAAGRRLPKCASSSSPSTIAWSGDSLESFRKPIVESFAPAWPALRRHGVGLREAILDAVESDRTTRRAGAILTLMS